MIFTRVSGIRSIWRIGVATVVLASVVSLVRADASSYRPAILDFADPNVLEEVAASGRYGLHSDEGYIRLRGSGAVFSREVAGPGTYYMRFALHEPEEFQYHRADIGLFVADPEDPGSDGYYLQWDPAGILTLRNVVDGERSTLNTFIRGGRDNPNRFEAGEYVDVTLHVPDEGDGVYVYCRASDTSGEPTTAFKLSSDLPTQGYFGAYNAKWHSHMLVYRMRYRPNTGAEE